MKYRCPFCNVGGRQESLFVEYDKERFLEIDYECGAKIILEKVGNSWNLVKEIKCKRK